jgi:hypothetical protein
MLLFGAFKRHRKLILPGGTHLRMLFSFRSSLTTSGSGKPPTFSPLAWAGRVFLTPVEAKGTAFALWFLDMSAAVLVATSRLARLKRELVDAWPPPNAKVEELEEVGEEPSTVHSSSSSFW